MLRAKLIVSVILSVIILANGLTVFTENGKNTVDNGVDFRTPYGTVQTNIK
ncbi:MAG: hypothetical protein GX923_09295 [Clostridia bacterium]|jgi:hypothetical protein|nr:hypothetical protein [Clostridia bacterium]